MKDEENDEEIHCHFNDIFLSYQSNFPAQASHVGATVSTYSPMFTGLNLFPSLTEA